MKRNKKTIFTTVCTVKEVDYCTFKITHIVVYELNLNLDPWTSIHVNVEGDDASEIQGAIFSEGGGGRVISERLHYF